MSINRKLPVRPVGAAKEPAQVYTELCQQGAPPELSRFLESAGPMTPAQLAAVLCVDLRARWRNAERLQAEDYLARFPQIQGQREAVLDLIYCEILAREDRGESPSAAEYAARFPNLGAELGRQIEMHHIMKDAGPTTARSERLLQATAANLATSVDAGLAPLDWALEGLLPIPAIPGYEITAPLGRGGMGVVYLAWQLQLNRQVALKMIRSGSLAATDDVARFLSEAEAVAALQHHNIVQVFEVGRHEGRPFMALEYVAGGSLAKKLQKGPLLPNEAARLVEQLARGMNAAHQAGIVHRDLKPANVLLSFPSRARESETRKAGDNSAPSRSALTLCVPKITDFGLAKRVESLAGRALASADTLTQTGVILGTPNYMAPEQALGNSKRVGPAADIFALGALLYECMTGRPPFKADSALETLQQVVFQEPMPLRQLQARIPHDLQTICLKCLNKQPQQRYASAEALAEDLRRWQGHEPILARPVGRLERTAKWVQRRPASAALAAALVLLLIAGLGGGFWYQQWQIWWAGEQARQETELAGRGSYLNQEVDAAVHEAEQERMSLNARLQDSLKVHMLLSDLTKWQQPLDRAQSALTRARKLAAGEPDLLEPELTGRLQKMTAHLAVDRQAYQLADKLDAIRQEAYTWIEDKFNTASAGPKYAAAFKKAGLIVETGTAPELAAQVRQSPARFALVAALDFWAEAAGDTKLRDHLLAVARLADPDPWRDQVRDPKKWMDRRSLEPLAANADVAQQSPQILIALIDLLQSNEGAVPLLRKAVLAHPQDFWLYFSLGTNSKELAEKIGYYQAALAIRPQSGAALNNLGVALKDNRDLEGAIYCYQKALRIDPMLIRAQGNLGEALWAKGDLKGASACFQKALEIDSNYAPAHNGVGLVLLSKGDLEEAAACFRKALKLDPRCAPAHVNLGHVLGNKNDWKGAITSYNKALEINPRSANAHYSLGMALRSANDSTGAIASYKKALECDPLFAEAQNNLGNVLLDSNDLEGAIACFNKALEINPKLGPAHFSLGIALQNRGARKEAIAQFQEAVTCDPSFARAHGVLGEALLRQGQFAEARQATANALRLVPPGQPLYEPYQKQLLRCEELLDRDQKLVAIQNGQARPADAVEQLALAELCRTFKNRYAAAAKFYADAFAALPQLATNLGQLNRYHAACTAVLASAGKGIDATYLYTETRAKLRQQALDWLRADVDLLWQQLWSNPRERKTVIERISQWQTAPDLASVRDAQALAQLPDLERLAWLQLWADVAEINRTRS